MIRYFVAFALVALCFSCTSKDTNLSVSGKIDGLKKGTLYLQKVEDTLLVSVDSVIVEGDSNFELEAFIESPQILFLYLDKYDNSEYDDRITFFAEEGEMTINTKLKTFEDATITGSINNDKLIDYKKITTRFDQENLTLIKADYEAQKENDQDKLFEIEKKYDNNLRRRYLYTVNFAINNNDLELAPYLAVSEVFDANVKYLDTIYNSLVPKVKKSLYGKELKRLIKDRKAAEE